MINRIISRLVIFLLLFGVYLTAFQFQAISDWWHLRSYDPPAEIASVAEMAEFSPEGRDYFYLFSPSIESKSDFNSVCDFGQHDELTKVVGCFNGENIFILDIEPGPLEEGEIVTAAHEMLHAVYFRFSKGERERIDELLSDEIEKLDDKAVLRTLAIIGETNPDSYLNEAHSIIGTEVQEISPELEKHYNQYFLNRLAVVEKAENYSKVFSELETELNKLADKINSLISWLNTESKRLDKSFEQLDQDRQALQRKIDSNDSNQTLTNEISAFQVKVDRHNTAVEFYREEYKKYQSLKTKYDNLNLKYNQLAKTLDGYEEPKEIVE